MPCQVKSGEIDRDNNPVRDPETIATFNDRSAAEAFVQGKIAEFDHNGFVPDGQQAGWWGRNDRDRFEKFHFWIEGEGGGEAAAAGAPEPLRDKQYRGLP